MTLTLLPFMANHSKQGKYNKTNFLSLTKKGDLAVVQENMINKIVSFVGQYHQSTASIAVCRRILGSYPEEINQETLTYLRNKLQVADPEEVESLYYIIK